MAWEDRTPFEAIEQQYGLSESELIKLMRREMPITVFKRWRTRVSGRKTKHRRLRPNGVSRHQSSTHNKVNR
jgi:uncharacterized protein (TIGR03643 family)